MKDAIAKLQKSKARNSTIRTVIIHGFIPASWAVIALFVAPRFRLIFDQLGSEIPAATRLLFNTFDLIQAYFHVYLLLVIFALTIDGAIYYCLFRAAGKWPAKIWSLLVLLSQGGIMIVFILAMYSGLIQTMTNI